MKEEKEKEKELFKYGMYVRLIGELIVNTPLNGEYGEYYKELAIDLNNLKEKYRDKGMEIFEDLSGVDKKNYA